MAAPLGPSSRKPCGSIAPTRRAAGKIRECKHSAKLAPLLVALPKKHRALGLHISAEHAGTREYTVAEVEKQLAPLKHGNEELLRRAQGEIPEKHEHQTAAQRRHELDKALTFTNVF